MSLSSVAPEGSEPRTRMAKVIACLIQTNDVKQAAQVAGVSVAQIRKWRSEDEVFQQMLAAADEVATNAIIEEGISNVRFRIKGLGDRALDVLAASLNSHDERVQLQAASKVLQLSGVADKAPVAPKKEHRGGGVPSPQDGD